VHVGIDACCWSNRRGFGRYTRELVSHIISEGPQHQYTLIVDGVTAQESVFPPGARVDVVLTSEQPSRAASADGARSPLDLWRMSRAAARNRFDLFFFPAVYSFYPVLRQVPTVVTFHDAIPESYPELIFPSRRSRLFWGLKSWLARKQADRLLTVSESARDQIAAAFGYPPSAIDVITEGVGSAFRPLDDPRASGSVRARYRLPPDAPLVLYVGGISPHKNLDGLLRAMRLVFDTSPVACHLALVGDYAGDSFHGCYEELRTVCGQLGLEDRVTFLGFVPNEDLVALYNAATLLVLPSFLEGFGLPAVEAMACGLPVAASRRGSLGEVVGEAGILFDPSDRDEMARAIRRLLEAPELRSELRVKGLRRAEGFSWNAAARAAVRLFEETARR